MRFYCYPAAALIRCNRIAEEYDGDIFLAYSEHARFRNDRAVEIVVNPKIHPIDDEI